MCRLEKEKEVKIVEKILRFWDSKTCREIFADRYAILIIMILCFILLFAGMWSYPLIDVDETRYAVMSRDLIGSGNWNLLFVNGVPFIEKPPLYFWLTAISIKLFGFNEFAVRFPVMLQACIAVLGKYCTR